MPGEVPSGWTAGTLAQIAEESRDRFLPGQDSDASMPYVGLEHIEPGVSRIRLFGSADQVSSQKTAFVAGDVLFGKLRPYLKKVAQVDRAGVCSTDILALRPRRGTDAGFLLTLLSHDETIQFATGTSAGTKMPRTSWSSLSEYAVLVPPLPEQKKIAAILSSVDEAIQATQEVIDQTRRVKEGLLQDLLTRGLPGHTRFKQTEIGEIPESWEVWRLGDALADIQAGWSPACTETPPTPGQWGVLKVSAITQGRFDATASKTLPDDLQPRPELEVRNGDVLLVRANGNPDLVGRTVFVYETPPYLMLSDKTLRLVPMLGTLLGRFLALLMQSRSVGDQMMETLSGSSGQKNVSQKVLGDLRVAIPPLREQEAIANLALSLDDTVSANQIRGQRLREMKGGLLQDLLTGKVRVATP